MILPELDSLPKSVSSGPESWGEAFGRVVDTSDQVMVAVENITASQDNFRFAYQSYIDEVEQATGERLQNPMDIDVQTGTFQQKSNPTYSVETGDEWREERSRVAMERFEASRAALAAKYPAQAGLISLDIDGRVKKRMQDAERASLEALASPELGMAGRLAAQIVGGLKGSARDPYQWSMAIIGGGAGTARTVAGRIGQVMLTEALLNGGQEAVLQAASQERKARAGLEHGLDDALKNVGIAATFGSLFGGVSQGGAELARIFRLGEGGDAIAARVLDGRPEPGDVEMLAKAMNVELSPERLDLINRSFEERILDEVTIPQDGNPAAMRVYEAALRHAEDPDNFPAPELVERMVAEEEAGRLLTLSAEQYERAYGGDQNAIDDIADTFFADDGPTYDFNGSAREAMAAAEADLPNNPELAGLARRSQQYADPVAVAFEAAERGDALLEQLDLFAADLRAFEKSLMKKYGVRSVDALDDVDLTPAERGYLFYADSPFSRAELAELRDMVQPLHSLAEAEDELRFAVRKLPEPGKAASWADRIAEGRLMYVGSQIDKLGGDARVVLQAAMKTEAGRFADANDAEFMLRSYAERLERYMGGEPPPAAAATSALPSPRRQIAARPDPIEGQRIRPDVVAEPLDDAAMRAAEVEAGDLVEPEIDANGNPKSLLDYIAVEDGDGNYRLAPARQALEEADEGNLLADLLESCKL